MTPLRAGARVAVVAPGGALEPARLEAGLSLLREWELEPVLGPHLFARRRWLAGSPEERAADLTWALGADGLDAVWFARGGSGTADVLPRLPWERLPDRPVLGFSDATALLVALAARGRTAIHGPVLTSLANADPLTLAATRDLVREGRAPRLTARHLSGPASLRPGPLVGGNLTVLASLAGTPWALRAAGVVLLLEDVDEAPYRLERSLAQLIAAGSLEGVRGVVWGELLRCGEDPGPVLEMIAERLAPLGVPVLCDLPVGHGPRNLPFVHGAGVRWEGGSLQGD